MNVQSDLSMKTDRKFLAGSATKAQPKRSGVPSYTGTMSAEFASLTDYERFTGGTTFSINASWTGASIESPWTYEFVVSIPVAKFTGSTPSASLDNLTVIDMPFTVLDGGSGSAVSFFYTSTDTSL